MIAEKQVRAAWLRLTRDPQVVSVAEEGSWPIVFVGDMPKRGRCASRREVAGTFTDAIPLADFIEAVNEAVVAMYDPAKDAA